MIRSESDSQGSSQDQMVVFNFVDDQMNPGEELLIVHFELMRSWDWIADSVLDGSNDSLHCSNASMMLGESDCELDGGELDVEGWDHLHLRFDQVLTHLDHIEPGVNPDDPRGISQGECSLEPPSYALSSVVMKDLQVNIPAGEAEDH